MEERQVDQRADERTLTGRILAMNIGRDATSYCRIEPQQSIEPAYVLHDAARPKLAAA
jgi:hypothetical protein